jgi:hypothetical protein
MPAARPVAWNPSERRNSVIDKPKKAKKTTAWQKIAVAVAEKSTLLQKTWMIRLQATPVDGL